MLKFNILVYPIYCRKLEWEIFSRTFSCRGTTPTVS